MVIRALNIIAICMLASACGVTTPKNMRDGKLPTSEASSKSTKELNDLCYRYKYGDGAHQDFTKALYWCTRGAEAGDANCQTLLAEMYFNGDGVKSNVPLALRYLELAAAQSHAYALLSLFNIYKNGYGVDTDEPKAISYLRRAANLGMPEAIEALQRLERLPN